MARRVSMTKNRIISGKCSIAWLIRGFHVAHLAKNLPELAMCKTLVQFLDLALEKGEAMHSRILGLPWWFRW